MTVERIIVEGLAETAGVLPRDGLAGDLIFVSGTLGTLPDSMDLVPGGTGPETERALRNVETILAACGTSLQDLVKVNVFLRDLATFSEMNEAYLGVFGQTVPARITVGRVDLALGAAVEIDGVAYKPKA